VRGLEEDEPNLTRNVARRQDPPDDFPDLRASSQRNAPIFAGVVPPPEMNSVRNIAPKHSTNG
jgi:hypothetical protein